jgi:hypothetical protein
MEFYKLINLFTKTANYLSVSSQNPIQHIPTYYIVKGMKGGQTKYNERINVVKAAWDGVDMTGKSVTMQSDLDR